jgi:nucleoside-diphosphate-sugar epimerase
MIVAVTGANGFIGRHLVRRFSEAGCDVRPLLRRDLTVRREELARTLDAADVVVHAAGATRAPTVAGLRNSNVRLTELVIGASRLAGVGRLVFVSSQAAAGPSRSRDEPVTEAEPAVPIEAYGQTKLDAERLLHSAEGLPFVIVRPAAVFGPGDRDFLAVFRLAHKRIAIYPGNRNQWISIIHVDDLVEGILRASTVRNVEGRTYFMANAEPVRWRELFRACAAAVGRPLLAEVQVPRFAVSLGAAFGDAMAVATGRAGLMTTRKAALAAPAAWVCSSTRAHRELQFAPGVALADGIRATYEWYRANRWL